jgi:hypothetical protein
VLVNGSDTSSPAANATSFSFSTPLATGVAYSVSIRTQPAGLTCTVTGGSGTVGSASVASVVVSCPSPWIRTDGASALSAPGTYGTRGIAAAGNTPGARVVAGSWTDAKGNLWLFGGTAASSSQKLQLSDLWEFVPARGLCSLATSAPGNVPGARDSASAWTTSDGTLWLFGGRPFNGGAFNDLWRFSEQPPGS